MRLQALPGATSLLASLAFLAFLTLEHVTECDSSLVSAMTAVR